jgi:hypothetical protein
VGFSSRRKTGCLIKVEKIHGEMCVVALFKSTGPGPAVYFSPRTVWGYRGANEGLPPITRGKGPCISPGCIPLSPKAERKPVSSEQPGVCALSSSAPGASWAGGPPSSRKPTPGEALRNQFKEVVEIFTRSGKRRKVSVCLR